MSTSDYINTVSILLVLQNAGIVFGRQYEQKVLTFTLYRQQDQITITFLNPYSLM